MFTKIFKSVDPDTLNENFFKVIHNEWMLITAGTKSSFNTMTASWGTTGILWNKRIAVCFIRPTRYTFEFTEKNQYYTLSFFDGEYENALLYCGSHSGRNVNKVEATGLKEIETPTGNITFIQSRLVFECRKLYSDFIKEDFFHDRDLARMHYPRKDFHKFYIGEIVNCYQRILEPSVNA